MDSTLRIKLAVQKSGRLTEPSLETVFLRLTGRDFRD